MHKVSMIMPVYNSDQYLREAVDSVIRQDLDDFELILVDDGSTDGSGKICDEYAAAYPNIRVIHQENRGICAARNRGLDIADGEYIGFCDNDDILLQGALSDSYARAGRDGLDLMRYNCAKRYENREGKVWESVLDYPEVVIRREDFPAYYSLFRNNTVWTALYRRSIIEKNHIRFDEGMRCGHEDVHFNLQFIPHCEKIGYNPTVYYWWKQRDIHSTSRKFSREGVEAYLCCLPLEYEFLMQTCGNRVSSFEKNRHMIDLYVYQIAEYMSIPGCRLTAEEKVSYLEELRKSPVFDEKLSGKTAAEYRRQSLRGWLILRLFYAGRYRLLLFVVKNGMAILGHFRFRQDQKSR